jgi:hypothetical protein
MNVLDNMNLPDVVVPLQQPSVLANNNGNVLNGVNGGHVNHHHVNVNVNDAKHDDSLATAENPVFLLVASRDLDEEEHDLLNLYGKVLKYDNCHVNIPLDQLIKQNHANYVIFDVRDKNHRMAISKASVHHDNPHVHIIAVVSTWEKLDDFVDDAGCENCLSSLPPKQAFKKDFDTLLLEKKIRKPSCIKNVLRLILKAWGGWAKE